ncbi:MAG: Carbamoyl-phosphate synthase small chain [Sodalis sp.]|nr:MAG: Carbamoyl-phosphate synthase small chain [Sodalis sp.]
MIRRPAFIASNFYDALSLSNYPKQQNIVCIADIDTRKLTRLLLGKGHKTAVPSQVIIRIRSWCYESSRIPRPERHGIDLAQEVSTTEQYS